MTSERPELDKRKAFILATVVYEYIATAEPVGSNTLTQKYRLGVSSATIRNEMAELEAAGYLVQPHTSSGRVPSDIGYRTYVDRLMTPESLGNEEQRRIRDEFRAASRELDDVIEHTTRLVSSLSKSLAIAIAPSRQTQTFRHVQVIWLSARRGLAVIVTSLGVATQHVFELEADVDPDALTRVSNVLNAKLGGLFIDAITAEIVDLALAPLQIAADLRRALHDAIREAIRTEDPHLAYAGAQTLLDQPEFHDLRKLRAILRIVEEQKTLYDLVADGLGSETASVKIGQELGLEMSECSLVTVPYRFGDRSTGVLAILGPRRMPYGRLLAIASSTAESLGTHLDTVELR